MQKKSTYEEISSSQLEFTWDEAAAAQAQIKNKPGFNNKHDYVSVHDYFSFLHQFHISEEELLRTTIFDEAFSLS